LKRLLLSQFYEETDDILLDFHEATGNVERLLLASGNGISHRSFVERRADGSVVG
jgi:hypothetical protein